MKLLSLEAVRELAYSAGKNPRVHPNGFIQLDLGEVEGDWHESQQRGHSGSAVRLHIWNPPGVVLPHQDTVNEVHDHVFDMRSTLLKGSLYQRLYEFVAVPEEVPEDQAPIAPTHERYQAVYVKSGDSRLQSTGEKGLLRTKERFKVNEGDSYTQSAFSLHDTETPLGTVVTYMEKVAVHEGDATVICPIDQPPDNSFDRATAMSEEDLWNAIDLSTRDYAKRPV